MRYAGHRHPLAHRSLGRGVLERPHSGAHRGLGDRLTGVPLGFGVCNILIGDIDGNLGRRQTAFRNFKPVKRPAHVQLLFASSLPGIRRQRGVRTQNSK
ncbi:hypothetical protein SDC9_124269 [bioreactor metagenome]|uniref:Uncharacterized protein n=1 Tax=bioreactor metagenome TaxID=1076179 RepID=A0A645CK37_9ZZZZ